MEIKNDIPILSSDGITTIEEEINSKKINIKKSEQDESKLNSLLSNISTLLKEIISKYNNKKNLLSVILAEIIDSIKLIISEYSNDLINVDTNSNIILHLQNQKFKKKIQLLNNEINIIKDNFNVNICNSNNINNSKNFYKLFQKKFNLIKKNFQENELKYLLYIEEQKKQIQYLEKELKKLKNENLPKNITKSIRCFPNFVQYNFKEDISPKSIPLHQTMQKSSRSVIKKSVLKINFDNQNSTSNTNNNSKCNITGVLKSNHSVKDYKNKKKETELNKNKKIKLINKNFNRISNNHKRNNSNNSIVSYSSIINENKYLSTETQEHKLINRNKIMKSVNEYQPHTLINNTKKFFLSHPKIRIAELEKDKENPCVTLWKKLKIKYNKNKNSNQNPFIVFPSYLNETLVNLQKLRLNKFVVDDYFEKMERDEKAKSKKKK